MTKLTEGSSTTDMSDFLAAPGEAGKKAMTEGAHIPREALVRWLRGEAQKQAAASKGTTDKTTMPISRAIHALSERVASGETIS